MIWSRSISDSAWMTNVSLRITVTATTLPGLSALLRMMLTLLPLDH